MDTIHLTDYSEFKDNRAIKQKFKMHKNKTMIQNKVVYSNSYYNHLYFR